MIIKTSNIYNSILDFTTAAISIYLAFLLRGVYYRTKSKESIAVSIALIIFSALGIVTAIVYLFTDIPINDLGAHQWTTIIFLTMLVFIFKPSWHRNQKAEESKDRKAA